MFARLIGLWDYKKLNNVLENPSIIFMIFVGLWFYEFSISLMFLSLYCWLPTADATDSSIMKHYLALHSNVLNVTDGGVIKLKPVSSTTPQC